MASLFYCVGFFPAMNQLFHLPILHLFCISIDYFLLVFILPFFPWKNFAAHFVFLVGMLLHLYLSFFFRKISVYNEISLS